MNAETGQKKPEKMGFVRKTLFILSIPLGLFMLSGNLIAWPLEKYRHKNFAVWFTWTLLRAAGPGLILGLAIGLLIHWIKAHR